MLLLPLPLGSKITCGATTEQKKLASASAIASFSLSLSITGVIKSFCCSSPAVTSAVATTEEKQQKLKPPEGEREEKAAIALCRALYSAAAARAFAPAADLLFRCRGTWLFISERCSFRGCSLRERSTFSPLGPLLIKSWMAPASWMPPRVAAAARETAPVELVTSTAPIPAAALEL